MANTTLNIRTDSEIKKEAQELFAKMGLDMTTAINMFLYQVILEQAIPFRIGEPLPNAVTLKLEEYNALLKATQMDELENIANK